MQPSRGSIQNLCIRSRVLFKRKANILINLKKKQDEIQQFKEHITQKTLSNKCIQKVKKEEEEGKKAPDQGSKENRRNVQRGLWTGQYLNGTELSPNEQKGKERKPRPKMVFSL